MSAFNELIFALYTRLITHKCAQMDRNFATVCQSDTSVLAHTAIEVADSQVCHCKIPQSHRQKTTMANTPVHTEPPSPLGTFGKLPTELRNRVYEYVLLHPQTAIFIVDFNLHNIVQESEPAILRLSKVLRAEILPFCTNEHFWANAEVVVRVETRYSGRVRRIAPEAFFELMEEMRDITFEYGADEHPGNRFHPGAFPPLPPDRFRVRYIDGRSLWIRYPSGYHLKAENGIAHNEDPIWRIVLEEETQQRMTYNTLLGVVNGATMYISGAKSINFGLKDAKMGVRWPYVW